MHTRQCASFFAMSSCIVLVFQKLMRRIVMRCVAFCVAIILLVALSNNVAEAQGFTNALRARASKVKDVIKPATDKFLPRLRTGAVGALLVAMTYAGGMHPTDVNAHDVSHLFARNEAISQNTDKRPVMPVYWLAEESSEVNQYILSPELVRNLANNLARFRHTELVKGMINYWEENLGERGISLRNAVEDLQRAAKDGRITQPNGQWTDEYEGLPIETLKQQLAYLTLTELMGALNAAFRGYVPSRPAFASLSAGKFARRYLESGYVKVDNGWPQVEIHLEYMYNFNSDGKLVARPYHEGGRYEDYEDLESVGYADTEELVNNQENLDAVLHLAIINNHTGIIKLLLRYAIEHDTLYDLHQHLQTATELEHSKMVILIQEEIRRGLNQELSEAIDRGDLKKVAKLLASGADDFKGALSEAAFEGNIEILELIIDSYGGYVDFNELFRASVLGGNKEMKDYLVAVWGADDYVGALSEVIGHEAETSNPHVRSLVYTVLARGIPSELNATLRIVLGAYDVVGDGIEVAEDLVRALIRAGANDLQIALEMEKDEAEYLLKIFAEERAKRSPTQSPQQH